MINKELRPRIVWQHRALRGCMYAFPFVLFFSLNILTWNRIKIGELIICVCLIGFICGITFLLIRIGSLFLKNTTYYIKDKYIKMVVEFIIKKHQVIYYKDIKEIIFIQGFFQRMFSVGNITVVTHATKEHAGMTIHNITNYSEVYDILMKKIEETRN